MWWEERVRVVSVKLAVEEARIDGWLSRQHQAADLFLSRWPVEALAVANGELYRELVQQQQLFWLAITMFDWEQLEQRCAANCAAWSAAVEWLEGDGGVGTP